MDTNSRFSPNMLPVPDFGLRCLNCGYFLAGLPEHRCPECGKSFRLEDHIPPGDFPTVIFNAEMVRVTDDLAGLLRRYQIPFVDHKPQTETMMIAAGATTFRYGFLTVPRDLYFEVIDLLRRRAHGEPLPDPPPLAADGPEWNCPACGEENPGNFQTCWNCETEHAVAPAS